MNALSFQVRSEAMWGTPGEDLKDGAFSAVKEALSDRADVQAAMAVLAEAAGRMSHDLGIDIVFTVEGDFRGTGEVTSSMAIAVIATNNEVRANRFAFDAGISVQRPLPEDPK